MIRLHATCVAIEGAGVLLRGPSGAGKSDLALRLIDQGATLIADDQVLVARDGDTLLATAPEQIAGRIEVRGVGILRLPAVTAPLRLIIDLVPSGEVERLPPPRHLTVEGIDLPRLLLNPFECSTPAKVRLAVRAPASDINARSDPASSSAGFVVP